MTLPFKASWKDYIILIAVGIVIVLLIKGGCNQGHLTVAATDQLIKENKQLVKDTIAIAHERDSTKKAYQDSLDFVNGQLALRDNQLTARIIQLDSADKRITALIKRYTPIQPAVDTSIMSVPTEYVQNCADCFAELSNGQAKVKQYMGEIDNLNQSYQSKINLQQNRIKQLGQQNIQLASTLQDCISTSKTAENRLTPHGQLFFSWNVLWSPLPTEAGIGFIYQNKYRLQYGLKWYYGRYGQMIGTEINMPLSLKRR